MSELTTSQLIKIILGVFLVVVVVLGIFFFFKDSVIDFFKNLPGEEEETEDAEDSSSVDEGVSTDGGDASSLSCEDCRTGLLDLCSEEECAEIADSLADSGQTCQFTPKKNFLGRNKCVTVSL